MNPPSLIPSRRRPTSATVPIENGEFSIPLQAGSYTLRINKDGFLEALKPIIVSQATSEPAEIVLQVAPVHGAVTVIDGEPPPAALKSTLSELLAE